jgi:hypothetical protein
MDIDGQPATDSKTQSPISEIICSKCNREITHDDLIKAIDEVGAVGAYELAPFKSLVAAQLMTTEESIDKLLDTYEDAKRFVKYFQASQRVTICNLLAQRKLAARDAELLIYLLFGETVARKSESPPSPFGDALQAAYAEGFDD